MDEIARQIDRSWSQHEPERDRIPAEIWRRVRAFKRELPPTAAIIERVLKNDKLAQPLIERCVRRRGMARQNFLPSLFPGRLAADAQVGHRAFSLGT
jgi:hypothetical protein